MSTLTFADGFPTEVSRLVPSGGVVLAVTDDGSSDRFRPVRRAAASLAASRRASVVLFHAPPGPTSSDPGRPRRFDPLARQADGDPDGARLHTGSRRTDLLRDEALEVATTGAAVRVWLSRLAGPAAIAEAVTSTGSSVVLVPTEPSACGLLGRTIRRTLSYYAARLDVPVVAIDANGACALVEPLGSRPGRSGIVPFPSFDAPSAASPATLAGVGR